MVIPLAGWVAPFGYPRIKARSRLPVASRSVPRPSSPPGAKASTECPSRAQDPSAPAQQGSLPPGQNLKPTMHRSQPHPEHPLTEPPQLRRPATWQTQPSAHTRDHAGHHNRHNPNVPERIRHGRRQPQTPSRRPALTGQTIRPRHVQRRTRT